MTARLRFYRLPLLLPFAFAVHCIEEFPTFISFGDRHGIILPPSNGPQLIAAMFAFWVVIAAISLRAARARDPGDRRMTVWFVFFAAVWLHAVVNVGGALWLREYAPGAFVSACIYIPGGIYVARRALQERWVTPLRLTSLVGGGLLFYVVLAAVLIMAGRAIRT